MNNSVRGAYQLLRTGRRPQGFAQVGWGTHMYHPRGKKPSCVTGDTTQRRPHHTAELRQEQMPAFGMCSGKPMSCSRTRCWRNCFLVKDGHNWLKVVGDVQEWECRREPGSCHMSDFHKLFSKMCWGTETSFLWQVSLSRSD